jgi:hypothetical protein
MVGTSFGVTNFIDLLFDVLASLTDFICARVSEQTDIRA